MTNEKKEYLTFETRDGVAICSIVNPGVVDAGSVADFGKALETHIKDTPGIQLMIDFSNVEYMSSSTLTELIRAKELAEGSAGRLGICCLQEDVRRVFDVTNLCEHLNVCDETTLEGALARFKEAGSPS